MELEGTNPALLSVVVDWFRELKKTVLECAMFQLQLSKVLCTGYTAALGSPHKAILAVPVESRLPCFKMLFHSASECDEFHEQRQGLNL